MFHLLSVLLIVLVAGCSSVLTPAEGVEIRLANASASAFERVVVRFPDQEEDYGALAPQSQSGYRRVERAYRYAYIEVHSAGETLILQPIDYVGESLLTKGRYTYVLGLEATGGGLTLSLRRD